MQGEITGSAAIITVHGTGDTATELEGEKWWQRGSQFSGWLLAELADRGVEADIHPLLWSGANSAIAREEASGDLAKQIKKLAKHYDSVHVVGHSHGGNVANDAAVILNWAGGQARRGGARNRLRSITTVGTPFFKSEMTRAERFGAVGFVLMAGLSAILAFFLLTEPAGFLAATTGDAWFVDDEAIQARDAALGGILRLLALLGFTALLFIAPIAGRGYLRLSRAFRGRPDAELFSIWHPQDEAISFLQRVESLPVEPFAPGSLWRGSRTGGILWGVRAVFVLPLLGLLTLAADWFLRTQLARNVEFPPYGFGPAPLEAVGQQMVLFGITGAPLIFALVYLFYRAFAYLGLELGARNSLNNFLGGALKGIAFGRDGDHRIGHVSPRPHRFSTCAFVIDGSLATKMSAASADAAQRLFNKYRAGAFSVDSDQTEITREVSEDALTWDALIHTTYFDQREIASAISSHLSNSLNVERSTKQPSRSKLSPEEAKEYVLGVLRSFSLGTIRGSIILVVLIGIVALLSVLSEPLANNDHLADERSFIPPPAPYLNGQVIAKGEDCDVCPELVVLPGGTYSMGSPSDEPLRNPNEGPMRRVTVFPFAVGKYEVTFAEWDACVADGGCDGYSPPDQGWGRDDRPVIYVSWRDAQRYVAWLNSKVEGSPYRLLNEAEWEYAVRAGTTTPYWWGEEASLEYANHNFEIGQTMPVGSYPANPFGLHDMHGNVYEWVEDCYRVNTGPLPINSDNSSNAECSKVLRGASWSGGPQVLRSAYRGRYTPTDRLNVFGFRIARTLEP